MDWKRGMILIVSSLTFVACGGGGGGGGSSSTTSTTASTYVVSGTVPGTLIEAHCYDGSYYSTNSVDNGTSNHPFELELPVDIDCKLVMITNEDDTDSSNHIITPIELSDGSTTSTYFRLSGNLDLGYIGLAMSGSGMQEIMTVSTSGGKIKIVTHSSDPLDNDNDGIPNVYEDDDDDGIYNKDDTDDDGDGIIDSEDKDHRNDKDGDGIEDIYDTDDDGDGIKDSKDSDHEDETTVEAVTLPTKYTESAGRLLSSQCYQCHGTDGISSNDWDSIAGEDDLADEIHDDDPIMNAQAKGYSNNEIDLMGKWLEKLPKDDD